MNLKKLAAGVALAIGVVGSAGAVTLTAGDLKFTINNFDAGTVGYSGSGPVCTTVAECDAAAALPAPNAFNGEDSWGIFSVASITRVSDGSNIYVSGQGGKFLTGMFGGVKDAYVEVAGLISPTTTTAGVGGWLNLYETTANYNSALGPTGRLGEFGYTGITDVGGTLILSAEFGAGALAGVPWATYTSTFQNTTISGHGSGYLDVTGGTWMPTLDTNAQFDFNGGTHDLFLDTTYHPTAASTAAGWTVVSATQVDGQALPEPASIALFGLGLAGMAGLRRRAAKK
jgi:hypothetical protein